MILNEKAYIFVCGDASRMAKDVENAFIDILALHNENMDKREATKYITTMQNTGRYMQDIWSSIIVDRKKDNKNKDNDGSIDSNDNSELAVSKRNRRKAQLVSDLIARDEFGSADENQKENESD